MEKVQDIVIKSVQEYLAKRLSGALKDNEIEDINDEVEMKILSAFYEMGIPSSIR
jgi:hypothetical protein